MLDWGLEYDNSLRGMGLNVIAPTPDTNLKGATWDRMSRPEGLLPRVYEPALKAAALLRKL